MTVSEAIDELALLWVLGRPWLDALEVCRAAPVEHRDGLRVAAARLWLGGQL